MFEVGIYVDFIGGCDVPVPLAASFTLARALPRAYPCVASLRFHASPFAIAKGERCAIRRLSLWASPAVASLAAPPYVFDEGGRAGHRPAPTDGHVCSAMGCMGLFGPGFASEG